MESLSAQLALKALEGCAYLCHGACCHEVGQARQLRRDVLHSAAPMNIELAGTDKVLGETSERGQ